MGDLDEHQRFGWLLRWLGLQRHADVEARVVSFPRAPAPAATQILHLSLDGGSGGGGTGKGALKPQYPGNRTSTTKYTLVTFLPKALFEQYR